MARTERGFPQLRLDRENRKETEIWGEEKDCFELFEKRRREGQFVVIEEIAIAENPIGKKPTFPAFIVGSFVVEVTAFGTQLAGDFLCV